MKKCGCLWMMLIIFSFQTPCLAEVPHQIGDFALGSSISAHKDRLKMNTAYPIRYMAYLKEVEVKPFEGFKSGLIHYGACAVPGRIVRVKLKYMNSGKKFYDTLFKLMKKRFGEPTEWRGDAFQVVIAWKWSFTDKENNKISMILQHNRKDMEEKVGNSIKIAVTNFIDEECNCYNKKYPEGEKPPQEKKRPPEGKIDWERLLPH